MGKIRKFLMLLFVFIFTLPFCISESYIINSVDWRDIYSGLLFGRINDKLVNFIPSDRAGDYILSPHKNTDELRIISSEKLPFKFGYEQEVQAKGLNAQEEFFENVNLGLFEDLDASINNFIVIDDSYGYNAISVAPYAGITNSYVLFMDKDNYNEYMPILRDKEINDLIIYGIVDREVRNALEGYDPIIINDYGDRFRNNVEITKRYREEFYRQKGLEARQVILTNGEFIEEEIMSGTQPILFIGRMNVPLVISQYILNSTINVGVLIGNELITTAQYIKDTVGINTFVKFGRSARDPTGLINEVEDLDRYPVPKVSLGAEFVNVQYNTLSSQVLITVRNIGPIAIYLSGSYSILSDDNDPDKMRRFGDTDPEFLESGETKTFVYVVERIFEPGNLKFDGFILFGESKFSLEFRLDDTRDVEIVEYQDDTMIEVTNLVYYRNQGEFVATVKNIGTEKVYFNLELLDVIIMDVPQSFGAGDIFSLEPGKSMEVSIEVPLSKEDYENNGMVDVRSFYGKSEDALVKRWIGEFELKVSGAIDFKQYVPTAMIIILLVLIILEATKKKCPNCKKKNPKSAKHCKRCGHSLKK